MIVSFVVAMSQNHVIGVNQGLPWHIPADLRRFKKITLGHPVVMGRKTFDSVGRPLPGRENIVITRQDLKIPGVKVVGNLDDALKPFAGGPEEVFILGGGQIFSEALPLADRIYLTLIERNFEGDVKFPSVNWSEFEQTFEETHVDPIPFKFINYQRKTR
jgi:dihydrofolate reductase